MKYGLYYQALVNREKGWYFTAILRSFEHMCFDRTLDKQKHLFEFYVPQSQKEKFEAIMNYFEQEGLVTELQQLPNRLENETL